MRNTLRLLVGLGALAGALSATPITGRLVLNGITLVGDTPTTIDFNYPGCGDVGVPWCTPPPDATSSSTGQFIVGSGSSGSFFSLIGTTGTINSFDSTIAPVDTPINYNLISIPGLGGDIFLTQVHSGSYSFADCTAAPAPGQTCTPILPDGSKSPLELSNSPGSPINSHALFSVNVMVTSPTGEVSTGTGTFSTDFSGFSYQTLLQHALAGDVITTGYHGDLTLTFTPIPEPSTVGFVLSGIGLIALGIVRRRRA
jgi:hypothetical protein